MPPVESESPSRQVPCPACRFPLRWPTCSKRPRYWSTPVRMIQPDDLLLSVLRRFPDPLCNQGDHEEQRGHAGGEDGGQAPHGKLARSLQVVTERLMPLRKWPEDLFGKWPEGRWEAASAFSFDNAGPQFGPREGLLRGLG